MNLLQNLDPSPASNPHHNPAPAPQLAQLDSPINPPNCDPLTELAVSAEEKALLATAQKKIINIKMEKCNQCHEKWFDLNVQHGACAKCRKDDKYKPSNNMFSGIPPPDLPELSQIEEMLISPVHALIQLWQVRGGHSSTLGIHVTFQQHSITDFHCFLKTVM